MTTGIRLSAIRDAGVSAYLTLALLLSTGVVFPVLRVEYGEDAIAASQQLTWALVYSVAVALVVRRLPLCWRLVRKEAFTALLLCWSAASVAWSDAPHLTAYRLVGLAGSYAVGVALASRLSPEGVRTLLVRALVFSLATSALAVLLRPDLALMTAPHDGAWRGVFVHKNVLGRVAALAAFLVVAAERRGLRASLLLVASVAVVMLSRSVTALSGLVIAVALVHALRTDVPGRMQVFRRAALVTLAVVLAGTVVLLTPDVLVALTPDALVGLLGRDVTLTGRTAVWSSVAEMIRERPWLGYGYEAFWMEGEGAAAYVWDMTQWRPSHAHNGLLNIWLDLGVVGLLLLLAALASAWRRTAAAEGTDPSRALVRAYLVFFAVFNLTETSALQTGSNYSVFFVVFVAFAFSAARGSVAR